MKKAGLTAPRRYLKILKGARNGHKKGGGRNRLDFVRQVLEHTSQSEPFVRGYHTK